MHLVCDKHRNVSCGTVFSRNSLFRTCVHQVSPAHLGPSVSSFFGHMQVRLHTNLMFHVERKYENFVPEGIVSRETTCKRIPALLDSRWRGIIVSNHRDRKSKG